MMNHCAAKLSGVPLNRNELKKYLYQGRPYNGAPDASTGGLKTFCGSSNLMSPCAIAPTYFVKGFHSRSCQWKSDLSATRLAQIRTALLVETLLEELFNFFLVDSTEHGIDDRKD
jgi:hypothetical protein